MSLSPANEAQPAAQRPPAKKLKVSVAGISCVVDSSPRSTSAASLDALQEVTRRFQVKNVYAACATPSCRSCLEAETVRNPCIKSVYVTQACG